MTNQYDVYDEEAELLDARFLAVLNERPFYMDKELCDLKDQTRLLDHITLEAQADYFVGEFPTSESTRNFVRASNPALNSGVRFTKSDDWDFTPIPEDMPIIDFDTIDPIAF